MIDFDIQFASVVVQKLCKCKAALCGRFEQQDLLPNENKGFSYKNLYD